MSSLPMRQPIFPTQNTSDGRNLRIELLRSAPEPKSCTLHGNTTKSNAHGYARPLPHIRLSIKCFSTAATPELQVPSCAMFILCSSHVRNPLKERHAQDSPEYATDTQPTPFLVKCPMNPNFYQPLTKQDSAILGTNNFQHTLYVAHSGCECLLHLLFL